MGKDKASDCDVVLDGDGFLIDGATRTKVSTVSENTGMMSSNWLYKYGDSYVLECLDFSSSQSRQWLIFGYVNKKLVVDRVYSFSQEISSQSVPLWYGYECRGSGDALAGDKENTFSDSTVADFCGDAIRDKLKEKKNMPGAAMGVSLNVTIPVYSDKKIIGEASYLFFDTDKPDIFQMACYSNCALQSRGRLKAYIGRISKSAWFVSQINEDGCQSSGSYNYKMSQQKISFDGCVEKERVNLVEYLPGTKSEWAIFSGKSDGEGYRGEWVSKSGDNKRLDFFMYPLTTH